MNVVTLCPFNDCIWHASGVRQDSKLVTHLTEKHQNPSPPGAAANTAGGGGRRHSC
jgi:hypothetical protein